jgi:hypothetical protein
MSDAPMDKTTVTVRSAGDSLPVRSVLRGVSHSRLFGRQTKRVAQAHKLINFQRANHGRGR